MERFAKAIVSFSYLSNNDFASFCLDVNDAMRTMPKFAESFKLLDDIRPLIEGFRSSIPDKASQSVIMTAEMNQKRKLLEKPMKKLGNRVSEVADGDRALILQTRFKPSKDPSPVGQLLPPTIKSIKHGSFMGQMDVRVEKMNGAATYEGQSRIGAEDWVNTGPSKKTLLIFKDLTPGKLYEFQVRATGSDGLSDWSPSTFKMVV